MVGLFRRPSHRTESAETSKPKHKRSAAWRSLSAAGARPEVLEPRRLLAAAAPTLKLYNADTDQPILTMTNGVNLDLAKLNPRLTFAAIPNSSVGSFVFKLDGNAVKTESYAPYSIQADNNGDLLPYNVPLGTHTLSAVQYSQTGGTGSVLAQTTVSFTATRSVTSPPPPASPPPPPPPSAILSVSLVNATTDTVIGPLTNNGTIDLNIVGTALNLSVSPTIAGGSIVSELDGETLATDSVAPYSLGDASGDFESFTPTSGNHTFTFTQYSGSDGTGDLVATQTLNLTVVPITVVPPSPPPPPVSPPPPPTGVVTPRGAITSNGKPQAVISVIGQSGVAGHPVEVSAVNSVLANSPLVAQYHWDFGDPGSAYNTLPGWEGGHIYNNAGTYTVRLDVTDGNGNSSSATTTITVLPDNRRVVYVDAEAGNDANAGTIAAPIRSFAKASKLATSNVKILFHRGQTWSTTAWLSVTGQNVHIGAYGTGANPILNVTAGDCAIQTFGGSNHTVIENLTFDSISHAVKNNIAGKFGLSGMYLAGTNIAIRNCTFLNLDDAINSNQLPKGVIVQDNDAPLTTGIRGYFWWAQGSDLVALGNHVANSTREHNMRIKDGTRLLVAYNDFTNLSREKVDISDIRKGCIEMQRGSWSYIYGNTTHDGPIRVGPRGQDTEPSSTTTDWVVVENNDITNYQINVMPGTHHLMIRGNTFHEDNQTCIAFNPGDPQGRTISDLWVIGNTAYNNGTSGQFFRTEWGLAPNTTTIGENTYKAPRLAAGLQGTASIYVAGYDLKAFRAIYNNTWPMPATTIKFAQGGVMWVYPTWSGQTGFKDPTEWLAYPQVSGDVFKRF